MLGPEAKPGELNVLQVEAMGLKGPIKTPIALLEMGKTAQIILDLSFPDPPVTFTLVKGSGPVHIVGHNLLGKYMSLRKYIHDLVNLELMLQSLVDKLWPLYYVTFYFITLILTYVHSFVLHTAQNKMLYIIRIF